MTYIKIENRNAQKYGGKSYESNCVVRKVLCVKEEKKKKRLTKTSLLAKLPRVGVIRVIIRLSDFFCL